MIEVRAVIIFSTGEEMKTPKTVEQVIDFVEKQGKKVSVIDRDENGQPLSEKFWDSAANVAYVTKYGGQL
ncbi:hypothetical protein [Lactobacillus delbrueckii]|uniref:hypothetical protein n=1 Tax=Lactobacillus delbrueckii TaxID=1584 RepID=UPI0017810C8C|nr:hypothetical protein [Lactobacillus delbrueckii]MBD5834733.1 hypothetical protein [Lactobacillus delbrueckii]